MAYPNLEKLLSMSQEDMDGIEYSDRAFPSGGMEISTKIRETRTDDWGNPEWTGVYVQLVAPFNKRAIEHLAKILLSGENRDKFIFRDVKSDNVTG